MSVQTLSTTVHTKYAVQIQQTVGTSAAPLTPATLAQVAASGNAPTNSKIPTPDHIYVQAASANTGTINIVIASVTAVSGGAGYILAAGQSINLTTKNIADWQVIASAASQLLNITYGYGNV